MRLQRRPPLLTDLVAKSEEAYALKRRGDSWSQK